MLWSTVVISRCSPRKRQQHHATGVSSLHNQVRHAMGKRVCFAGASPRDDEQRLITTVLNGMSLFRVEPSKIILGHCFKSESPNYISKHASQSVCKCYRDRDGGIDPHGLQAESNGERIWMLVEKGGQERRSSR
jgi:hypothetical protein